MLSASCVLEAITFDVFIDAEEDGSDTILLTHGQIARYMGSAREVVSRMLKYFANEGIVEVSRKGVKILDRKRLHELAF